MTTTIDMIFTMSTYSQMNSSHCTAKAITALIVAIVAWTAFVVAVWFLRYPVVAVLTLIVMAHAIAMFLKYGRNVDKRRKR